MDEYCESGAKGMWAGILDLLYSDELSKSEKRSIFKVLDIKRPKKASKQPTKPPTKAPTRAAKKRATRPSLAAKSPLALVAEPKLKPYLIPLREGCGVKHFATFYYAEQRYMNCFEMNVWRIIHRDLWKSKSNGMSTNDSDKTKECMEYRKNGGQHFLCVICNIKYTGWTAFTNHLWRSNRYSTAGGYYGKKHLQNLLNYLENKNMDLGDENEDDDTDTDTLLDDEEC
eukprot:54641_1